jgi:hypothetical protein
MSGFGKPDLPPDTITLNAQSVGVMFTEHDNKLLTQLVIGAPEMGVYAFVLSAEVFTSLVDQCIEFANMTPEELREIKKQLKEHKDDD